MRRSELASRLVAGEAALENHAFANVAVASPRGRLFCSAIPAPGGAAIVDEELLRRVARRSATGG